MQVDIGGRKAGILGARHAVAEAVAEALAANGTSLEWLADEAAAEPMDILILSHPLMAGPGDGAVLTAAAGHAARAMAGRGGGRIVHLVSAMAAVPMRRHAEFSAAAAGIAASVRTLAMNAAPDVLVNAVAAGPIEEGGMLTAGDAAMLSHVPLGRAGSPGDVAQAVLFLVDPLNSYTTGQVLGVDGGWTAGYGRDF
jgi:NAD(P)-dependent dehydrogenase (short-subunit alcohol dehydrogenase family)